MKITIENWAPATAYVYRFFTADGELLYVGVTESIFRRLAQHVHKPWFGDVGVITVATYADQLEAGKAEVLAIETEKPRYNWKMLIHPSITPDPAVPKPISDADHGFGRPKWAARRGSWVGQLRHKNVIR
jgi:predicted GIY-YIG superfamily endonuclease